MPMPTRPCRLTYGQVERVDIPGSNIYQTTLDDLMPRHNAAVDEFNIPQGLAQPVHQQKLRSDGR
jgi:hypothetical protein